MATMSKQEVTRWVRYFEGQAKKYKKPCPAGLDRLLWESMYLAHMDMVDNIRRTYARQQQQQAEWNQETLFTLSDTPLEVQ